jgi:hypothetical protein
LNLTGQILATDLADGAVTSTQILDGTIARDDLASDSVNSSKIVDGTITGTDLASSTVTYLNVDASVVTTNFSDSGGSHTAPVARFNSTTTTAPGTVLMLKTSGISNPGSSTYFVDFQDSAGSIGTIRGNGSGSILTDGAAVALLDASSSQAVAFSNSGGVVLSSSGADYAEYILRENLAEKFDPCDIVGIKNGKVVKSNQPADQYMVISQKPVVIGNTPKASQIEEHELISFVGQVYVKVRGAVNAGQYIVASTSEPGVGFSRSRNELSNDEIQRVVGQAWETSSSTALRVVKVGITVATVPQAKTDQILSLQKELTQLRDELKSALSTFKSASKSN